MSVRKRTSWTSPLPVGRGHRRPAGSCRGTSARAPARWRTTAAHRAAPRSPRSSPRAGSAPSTSVPAASGSTAASTSCSGPGCAAYQPSRYRAPAAPSGSSRLPVAGSTAGRSPSTERTAPCPGSHGPREPVGRRRRPRLPSRTGTVRVGSSGSCAPERAVARAAGEPRAVVAVEHHQRPAGDGPVGAGGEHDVVGPVEPPGELGERAHGTAGDRGRRHPVRHRPRRPADRVDDGQDPPDQRRDERERQRRAHGVDEPAVPAGEHDGRTQAVDHREPDRRAASRPRRRPARRTTTARLGSSVSRWGDAAAQPLDADDGGEQHQRRHERDQREVGVGGQRRLERAQPAVQHAVGERPQRRAGERDTAGQQQRPPPRPWRRGAPRAARAGRRRRAGRA